MTEQLYFKDPLTLEFRARVTESRPMDGGRYALILEGTYFYPTSGGQEHDTGTIGKAHVLDVYKDGEDILHITDISMQVGEYPASVDRTRRRRAMQHHTAQHILSASFLEVADIDSLSANINGYSPSTIDLNADEVSQKDVSCAEEYANGIVFENLAVKTYDVTQDQINKLPVRKPPKVSGAIRIVEVDGFDYTPCGGTHCTNTGMIGMIKIVKTERVNQKMRIHFVAGYQALEHFNQVQAVAQNAALILNSSIDDVDSGIQKLQEQLKQAQHEMEKMRTVVFDVETEELISKAKLVKDVRLVTALFENRSASDLRSLANRLREEDNVVAVLGTFDNKKLSMVVACADGTHVDAREVLNSHLAPFGGRGGGNESLAQGGGAAKKNALDMLFKQTSKSLNVTK